MEKKNLLTKIVLISLILCNFTYSCKKSDENVLLDVFERQEVVVMAQNNKVLIYKKASESWLLTHQFETERKTTQAKLTENNLALLDDKNILTLYENSGGNKFDVLLKKKVPGLEIFNMNKKAIIGWTQMKELIVFHFQDHDKNIQTFDFSEQEIVDVKICQNQKVFLRSQAAIYSFDVQNSSVKNLTGSFDRPTKSWSIDENCIKIFILQENFLLSINTDQQNEPKKITEKIMIPSEKYFQTLQTNSKGSLITIENQANIYVYEKKSDKLALLKVIEKKEGQSMSKICQESLLVKFGEEVFSLEIISEKKKIFEEQPSFERILEQAVTSQFEQKQHLSFEEPTLLSYGHSIYETRVENGHILFGAYGDFRLYVHNGHQFIQKFFNRMSGRSIISVELNVERGWLFKGDNERQVTMYGKEGGEYIEKIVFNFESTMSIMQAIDVNSNGYMAISSFSEVYILKWNEVTFESIQNISRSSSSGSGIKMCNDNTLLFTDRDKFFVYRNISSTYTMVQDQQLPSNYMTATDDCNVVLLSKNSDSSSSNFFVYIKNQSNLFEQFTEKITTNSQLGRTRINNDGDIFVLPGVNGIEVWKYSHQQNDYILVRTYDDYVKDRARSSAALDDEYIVFQGFGTETSSNEGIYVATYNWQQDEPNPPSFGNKDALVINALQNPIQLPRQVMQLVITDNKVAGISKYSGAFLQQRSGDGYIEEKNFTESRFFSSLDMESGLGLMVLGSYSRKVYVHRDTGSGFSSLQTINTDSQVLKVSINAGGKLMVGTMSGDLISYTWDTQNFTLADTVNNEGSRVYGLKVCSDGSFLALLEILGLFVFKAYDADATVNFSHEFAELMQVQMAATDDCSTVVFSNTLLMQVIVFRKSDGNFVEIDTLTETFPLSSISINPDGDMFLVARLTESSSVLYKYNECTELFTADQELQEGDDDYATAITSSQIALGNNDGSIQVYDYSYGFKQCDSFGKKKLQPTTQLDSLTSERAIIAVSVSADLVAFVSSYVGFSLYANNEGVIELVKSFPDNHFISSIRVQSTLKTLVVGTYEKSVHIYIDSESGFYLNETIETASQVMDVDLSKENKLVVGMMNGDVSQYGSDGESFKNTPPSNFSHTGSRVYGVKACPEGRKVVLMEKDGVFKVIIYASDWTVEKEITTELEDELIESHLAATPGCQLIAISGITLSKVLVFIDRSGYELLDTIGVDEPVSSIGINPDGDLIIVGTITSEGSLLYQYLDCSNSFTQKESLVSGSFDEAVGMGVNLLVQGNEDGTVKISEYSWAYNITCPITASLPTRVKSEEDSIQKLSSTAPSNNSHLNTIELLLLIGGLVVFFVALSVLVYYMVNVNGPKRRNIEEDASTQTAMKTEQQM